LYLRCKREIFFEINLIKNIDWLDWCLKKTFAQLISKYTARGKKPKNIGIWSAIISRLPRLR
jgi:hypothetical protein